MIVVILFVVVCNILHSDCAPLKDNIVQIKFPRPIMHASNVTISGTINVRASTLRTTIAGRELVKKEECVIDIKPQDDVIVIGDIVPFTFSITAMSNQDENIDSLHVEFEGNNAGEQVLNNPCSFKSFSNVDRILFEGFKHIRNLTFLYKDEDGDDD